MRFKCSAQIRRDDFKAGAQGALIFGNRDGARRLGCEVQRSYELSPASMALRRSICKQICKQTGFDFPALCHPRRALTDISPM